MEVFQPDLVIELFYFEQCVCCTMKYALDFLITIFSKCIPLESTKMLSIELYVHSIAIPNTP